MSLASKIPNHPVSPCKGPGGDVWKNDGSQCRLCWLATYDRGYRRLWNIGTVFNAPRPPLVELLPCIHRGNERIGIPGCSTCQGTPEAYRCNNPRYPFGRCLIDGTPAQQSNARANGYLVCRDCGSREPVPGLEMPLANMAMLLESPPEALRNLPECQGDPNAWKHWKVTRLAIQDRLAWFRDHPPLPHHRYSGQGIVIAAGGPKYFRCAWVVAHIIRGLGCKLPIQFWYLGPQEIDANLSRFCYANGIETIDALAVARSLPLPPRKLNGWELKPFSTLHSKFREVLFLDADSVPLRDPTELFGWENYHEHGSIFWPDLVPADRARYCQTWIHEYVWRLFGLPFQSEPDFESGQFLIDKGRCYSELAVTMWINDHSDYFYDVVYGDKSTYHLAWRLMDRDYAITPHIPDWDAPCVVQKDMQGNRLFAHATAGKAELAAGDLPSLFPEHIRKLAADAAAKLESSLRFLHLTNEGGFPTILGNPVEPLPTRRTYRVEERKNHGSNCCGGVCDSSPGSPPVEGTDEGEGQR